MYLFTWGFPGGSDSKESACHCRRQGFDPSVRKIPWRKERLPLQYSCLKNPMDSWLCQVFIAAWVFSPSCCYSALLTAVAFLLVEHGLQSARASVAVAHGFIGCGSQVHWLRFPGSLVAVPGLQSTGSIVVAYGLSYSMACGIFPDQGSNPCLLQWQADSSPLSHQGSPDLFTFLIILFAAQVFNPQKTQFFLKPSFNYFLIEV